MKNVINEFIASLVASGKLKRLNIVAGKQAQMRFAGHCVDVSGFDEFIEIRAYSKNWAERIAISRKMLLKNTF